MTLGTNLKSFTDNEIRILDLAMKVSDGIFDHTALSYDEWCLAEELTERLIASRGEVEAAFAA